MTRAGWSISPRPREGPACWRSGPRRSPAQRDGKPYDEVRYYATLTVAPAAAVGRRHLDAQPPIRRPHALGQPSPGGRQLRRGRARRLALRVWRPHRQDAQVQQLNRVEALPAAEPPRPHDLGGASLRAGASGRDTGGSRPATSTGSAAWRRTIRPAQPNDLVSVADFARFDPESKTWTDLPRLPTPRSTHDSVVVGDKIYVIGGWSMNGGDSANSEFLDYSLGFRSGAPGRRLGEAAGSAVPPSALAVGAIDGKVYAIGGLTEDGKVVKAVDVYDPAALTWSRGPDLPGSKRQGFAPSAFGVDGKLYVSGVDGQVLRLSDTTIAGRSWASWHAPARAPPAAGDRQRSACRRRQRGPAASDLGR